MDKAKEAIVQKLKASGCRSPSSGLCFWISFWKRTVPAAKKSITAHPRLIQVSAQQLCTE